MRLVRIAVALVFIAAWRTFPADWPQYRGPNHDGSTPEKILTAWPQEGPPQLWKAPLGESFGSFAVSGGKAFCFIQRSIDSKDQEVAIAFDASTGRELWATPVGKPTYESEGGNGPRSTPTIDGNRVYLVGAYLVFSCLDADTGRILWQRDLVKEYGGTVLRWRSAASPVFGGDLIFINAGGPDQAFLAFRKDGSLAWKKGDDLPTHSTPVPATIHGVRQIIFFTQSGLVSLLPQNGAELWRYPFPFVFSAAMSPIIYKDIAYCSAGYGVGAGACRITKTGSAFKAAEIWRHSGDTINQWTTPICKDGYLYGIFGHKEFGDAPLKCIEMATGKELWSQPGFGSGGATILTGNHVLVQADQGPLVLVEATPKGYREAARTQPLGGKCWTMPVISHGRIYVRNTKSAVCLDVSRKSE